MWTLTAVPWPKAPPAWVHWGTAGPDVIELSSFDLPDADDGPSPDVPIEVEGAPPPTAQQAPRDAAPAKGARGNGPARPDADAGAGEGKASATTHKPVLLHALGPADLRPRMVGGRRSFYLRIAYPRAAREQGIEGRVVTDFVIGPNGTVGRVRVLKSLHPLCDSSVVRALRATRFVPGRMAGTPVSVRMSLPVRFQLMDPAHRAASAPPAPNVGSLADSHDG